MKKRSLLIPTFVLQLQNHDLFIIHIQIQIQGEQSTISSH